jgi:drug/metabolite transporter (DMT)-like permease
MVKDFLDALGKVKSRPLLIVFAALAISTFVPGGGPLTNPLSVGSIALPFFVFFSYVANVCWVMFVHGLNSRLADHDLANWGVILGGSVLSFCLCVTLWYLSHTPDPMNFGLLDTEGFVRVFFLFMFSVETINIKR